MKRVLVITYYWPPSGGSGVQRWVKFTKYLREYGWEAVIYTPENPTLTAIDKTLSGPSWSRTDSTVNWSDGKGTPSPTK